MSKLMCGNSRWILPLAREALKHSNADLSNAKHTLALILLLLLLLLLLLCYYYYYYYVIIIIIIIIIFIIIIIVPLKNSRWEAIYERTELFVEKATW